MAPRVDVWEESVGFLPHKVTAYEEPARKSVVYLRWRHDGNWKKKSLRRGVRTARGRLDPVAVRWALEQAAAQYARLIAGVPSAERAPRAPLTIRQGLTAAINEHTGKYPTDTPHRREVVRELERAIGEWGADTAWADIKRADLRKLWRRRILTLRAEKADGLRGAEITVQRVNAVAAWLRDEELIPAGACVAPRQWKQELRADWLELSKERALPDPKRPRHTLDEMRKILAVAGRIDPRFELAMAVGAELRLGQVLRCRRPDLDLEHATITVRGKGQKRGVVSKLTAGQMRVVTHALTRGYLRELEGAAADYPLFPAGQLTGGRKMEDPRATLRRHGAAPALGRSVLDGWFHEAERLAEVAPVKGRAAYGLRRAAVDAVKAAKISREGLQAHGGWADTQMPDRIYADQQMDYAQDEAREARAKLRGESE
jgi:integrase